MSDKLANTCYALLRIVSGFMFSFHGAQKILGLFIDAAKKPPLWSQLWVGGIIELVGGLLIMLGLGTRIAAFLCSGMMAVAYFQFHWKFQLDKMVLPGLNQGELAVLYCFVFLYFTCRGGVKWCLDGTK
jgi:putative oxidoreductase